MSAVCEKCSGRGYESWTSPTGKENFGQCVWCRGSGKEPMPLGRTSDALARRLILAAEARLNAGAAK